MTKVSAVRPWMRMALPVRREMDGGRANTRDQGTEMYSAKEPTYV